MTMERVERIGHAAASAEEIWAIARDFCDPWHPAIAMMRAERGANGGLIRAFTVHGEDTLYREQLTYFSDTERTLSYAHLEGISGADRYAAQMNIAKADGGCSITMSADIEAEPTRATEIAIGTRAVFEAGIKALSALPSPPKAKPIPTFRTVPTETIKIDGEPRLTITATPSQDGPLCLFLHGIGGGRGNWAAQLPTAAHSMQAAALDLRGYGDSTLGDAQTTIDDYCADILRVRDVLGADKLVLCGLSYGAWIATSVAMRHPELLSGLILSGGCTGMSEAEPEERKAFRASREAPLNAGQTPADFAPNVVQIIAGPNADEYTRQALRQSMAAIPAATYRDALNCFTNPPETFDFGRLSVPVLMMTGEHDRLAPPPEIRSVAARICESGALPNVQFEVVAGAGHVCNVEDPAGYNHFLHTFLASIAP